VQQGLLALQVLLVPQVQLVLQVPLAVSHRLLLELILQSALLAELVQSLLTQAVVVVAQQMMTKTF
jgi:hypothetical protein